MRWVNIGASRALPGEPSAPMAGLCHQLGHGSWYSVGRGNGPMAWLLKQIHVIRQCPLSCREDWCDAGGRESTEMDQSTSPRPTTAARPGSTDCTDGGGIHASELILLTHYPPGTDHLPAGRASSPRRETIPARYRRAPHHRVPDQRTALALPISGCPAPGLYSAVAVVLCR